MPKFCPKCGNQIIDDTSLFCNNCGSQLPTSHQEITPPAITQPIRKKSDDNEESKPYPMLDSPILKKGSKVGLIFIIIGVTVLSLILLAFISALVFPPIPTAKNVVGYTSKVTIPTPTNVIAPEVVKLAIGESTADSMIRVGVWSVQKTNQYSYYSEILKETQFSTSSPGKIFVIVEASFRNVGAKSIYANPYSFSITDSKGYKYDPDIMYFGDDGLKMQQLYLNQLTRGRILFTIPSDATGLRLQYDFGDPVSGPMLVTWPLD